MGKRSYQLQTGTILDDRYAIRGVLGEGGFGITYEAENLLTHARVAIKEFFCRDFMDRRADETPQVSLLEDAMLDRFEKEKARFLKEARVLRDFNDEPGIVHVNDCFESNGTAYIIMTFLEGSTLREQVQKDGRQKAATIFRQIRPLLRSLGKVHDAKIVHRDISPDNIMVSPEGGLCLIDFGAAYSYDRNTKTYTAIYKNGYAAAEQYRSDGNIGPAADLYSLCATLYYCLTGADPTDSLQRILLDDLQPPSKLGIKIDAAVEQILMKGLALKAEDRYQSAAELLAAIDKVYPDEAEQKKRTRKRRILAGVFASVAAFAGLFVFLHWQRNRVEYRFRNIETTVVWLSENENSETSLAENAAIIKDRLAALAGKHNYLWEEVDDRIRLEFPVDLIPKKLDPGSFCRRFLSRPGKMHLSTEAPTFESVEDSSWPNTVINRDGIESVVEWHGEIPGADREELSLPEEGDYDILRLTFTPSQAAALNGQYGDILNEKEKRLHVYFDTTVKGLATYFGDIWFTTGDGQSVYTAADWTQIPACRRSFIYNITHPAPNGTTPVTAGPLVEWERVDVSLVPGKYQKDNEALPAEYRLFLFEAADATPENNAAWIHDFIVFKNRLDALGIPYAIGTVPYEEGTIAVKCGRDAIGQYVADSLGQNMTDVTLCATGDEAESVSLDMQGARVEGSKWVIPFLHEWSDSNKENWMGKCASAEKGYYLRAGSDHRAPIASVDWATLQPYLENNEAAFSDLCLEGAAPGLQDADSLLHYLQVAAMEKPVRFYRTKAIFCDEWDGCMNNDFSDLPHAVFPECKKRFETIYADLQSEKVGVEYYPVESNPRANGSHVSLFTNPQLSIFYYGMERDGYVEHALEETRRVYEKYLADGTMNYVRLFFNRGDSAKESDSQISLYISCNNYFGTAKLSSMASIIGPDSVALAEEANAYVERDPVLRELLSDDWIGFTPSVP